MISDASKLIAALTEQQMILMEIKELMNQLEQTLRESQNELAKSIPDDILNH